MRFLIENEIGKKIGGPTWDQRFKVEKFHSKLND